MLKKRLGTEAIERDGYLGNYFKIPSTLIIPEGCEVIGYGTFCGCWWLKKIEIPGSVRYIDDRAFESCKSLREVVIPESIGEIGSWAFEECEKLKKVEVPKNVDGIGYCAFNNCKSATIILKKPKSAFKFIGNSAFRGCKYVKEEIRS